MTPAQLQAVMPQAGSRIATYLAPLNVTLEEFEINNPARQSAFLAQIAHESGQLRYVKELASGEDYEGRTDLGNTTSGDGVKYKGRGLIQITGRDNYRDCGKALGIDLLSWPEALERPDFACRSAGWFWKLHGLNELADAGNFERITRRINGGLNGQADRLAFFARAHTALEMA